MLKFWILGNCGWQNNIPQLVHTDWGDIVRKLKKNLVFFLVGAVGYGCIELLWRGRTHWTMLIAGGFSFMLFSFVAEKYKHRSLFYKSILCAVGVTAIELIFGILFNLILNMHIWDYSGVPLNFLGQICPLYTLYWGVLAFFLLPVVETLNRRLSI